MILIQLATVEGKIIYSNLPNNFNFQSPSNKVETVYCLDKKANRRQINIINNEYDLYFASYDEDLTNKIFKHYLTAFEILLPIVLKTQEEVAKQDTQKARRLKHNLINHSTKIQQELYKLVSQEALIGGDNKQIEVIQDVIKKKLKDAAYAYLRILKSINLMKSEFDVYDMLHSATPYVDIGSHPIHKVILLGMNTFWLDFLEKNINVYIEPSSETVLIDYKSFSVALSHIFDNAIKYCCPNSDFSIRFKRNANWLSIEFTMLSLRVEMKEIDNLFIENYSGEWAQKLNISGTGIGMNIIKRVISLNRGKVTFQSNLDPNRAIKKNGIPYELNQLTIEL
jgi:light-regulated signal transduction histidine kinase (bacteriophytochrome)